MVKIDKLDKYFNKGKSNENHVLKEISLELDCKGLVCILGESGSGKTTLLNTIGGLDTFKSGTICMEDTVLKKYDAKKMEKLRNEKFGYIFQNYYLLQDYTVAYNIKLALNMFNLTEEEKDARVDYVLDALDMRKYKKKLVSQLSGGQQQRVSIARALVKSPEIILADEPTGNLDEENTLRIMSILKSISRECLVILVSHERNIAHFFADRIIEIQDGVIKKDYANQASESYQRMDDANIYLRDMDVDRMEMEGLEVALYQEEKTDAKIQLNLAWKEGKLYIQSPDDVTLVLAGEESGCVMRDESRPKLEQSQIDTVSYELSPIASDKNASLSVREIWKMAWENIHMMGKKHKFVVGILLATSVLLVLALADYMMQRTIDKKNVVTDDSHYVTVSLEMNQSTEKGELKEQIDDYLNTYIVQGEYKDAFVDTTGVLTIAYDGFSQLRQVNGKLEDYSVVSVRHLKEEDLVCGRMPKNRKEMVIDRWLVEKFRNSGSVLSAVYQNENAMLNVNVSTMIPNLQMTIVGICDTQEPSIYVNDNVALGMSYVGYYVMSDEDLKELYPGEYDNLKLAENEVLLPKTKYEAYQYQMRWHEMYDGVLSDAKSYLDMKKCKVAGQFPDDAGAYYVVSQANCDRMKLKYIHAGRKFKVYTDDVEETIQFLKGTGKGYEKYFKVNAVCNYDEQLKAYREEQKNGIHAGYLVTLSVLALSLIMIYFTIKSNAIARSEELTVYRLLGISPESIMRAYMLEMVLITAYTCIPAILITSGIIKFIVSIPSLEIYLRFPWWMALLLIFVLFGVNSVISILPVWKILRKPPAQLAAKNG